MRPRWHRLGRAGAEPAAGGARRHLRPLREVSRPVTENPRARHSKRAVLLNFVDGRRIRPYPRTERLCHVRLPSVGQAAVPCVRRRDGVLSDHTKEDRMKTRLALVGLSLVCAVARRGASGGTGLHGPYRRHHQGRHRRGAARRDGRGRRHADRRRRHGRQGRGALRQPRAGALRRDRQALRVHRLPERERAGQRRLDRAARRDPRASAAWPRSVDVTSETPVIETKKQTVSTNVNLDELQNIPSARDPWVVLQTVPGIVVDRVNVGGAESGQQSNYQAKGANPDQNTWNMDGIAITDMGSLGASPTYYDFDMFQEMQVTTGGADPANATPGVQLNFVLRSGTSKWRGTTRYYFENDRPPVRQRLVGPLRPDCQLQPRRRVQGLGLRGRRADHPEPPLRVGRLRQDGAGAERLQLRRRHQRLPADRPRRDVPREHLGQGHRRGLVEDARELHLLPRQQAEVRPRRVRLPPRRDDLQPGWSDRPLQVRAQPDARHQPLHRRALRAYEERVLARAARRPRRPVLSR